MISFKIAMIVAPVIWISVTQECWRCKDNSVGTMQMLQIRESLPFVSKLDTGFVMWYWSSMYSCRINYGFYHICWSNYYLIKYGLRCNTRKSKVLRCSSIFWSFPSFSFFYCSSFNTIVPLVLVLIIQLFSNKAVKCKDSLLFMLILVMTLYVAVKHAVNNSVASLPQLPIWVSKHIDRRVLVFIVFGVFF